MDKDRIALTTLKAERSHGQRQNSAHHVACGLCTPLAERSHGQRQNSAHHVSNIVVWRRLSVLFSLLRIDTLFSVRTVERRIQCSVVHDVRKWYFHKYCERNIKKVTKFKGNQNTQEVNNERFLISTRQNNVRIVGMRCR